MLRSQCYSQSQESPPLPQLFHRLRYFFRSAGIVPVESVKPLNFMVSSVSSISCLRRLARRVNPIFSQNSEKLHEFFYILGQQGSTPSVNRIGFKIRHKGTCFRNSSSFFNSQGQDPKNKTLSPFVKYSVNNRFCRFPNQLRFGK